MSRGIKIGYYDAPTDTYSTKPADYVQGEIRRELESDYMFVKAGANIAAGAAVKLDTSVATGDQVVETDALDSNCVGVAETAISANNFGWITIRGNVVSAKVANGTNVGDKLRPGASAGVLEPVSATVGSGLPVAVALEANSSGSAAVKSVRLFSGPIASGAKIERVVHVINNGADLADGTTYKALIPLGRACVVTRIGLIAQVVPVGGTNTFKVLKGSSSGNSMLAGASFDPTTLTANQMTALGLTSTVANLTLNASGANSGIYIEYAAGTQSTDASGVAVVIEFRVTDLG